MAATQDVLRSLQERGEAGILKSTAKQGSPKVLKSLTMALWEMATGITSAANP